METITLQQTVGEIAARGPAFSRLFESAGIDYCCGGGTSLEESCRARGLDPNTILTMLRGASAKGGRLPGGCEAESLAKNCHDHEAPGQAACAAFASPSGSLMTPPELDLQNISLTELADHIEAVHHAYLHQELPRLARLLDKVVQSHGEKDARLHQVREVFHGLRHELSDHLMKEERILFPVIRQIESAGGAFDFHCGSVANPIRQMEFEHVDTGGALERLRALTDGYTVPEWACKSYRMALDALAYLERDIHEHIHKENNVLFPRAIALEGAKQGGCGGRCAGLQPG